MLECVAIQIVIAMQLRLNKTTRSVSMSIPKDPMMLLSFVNMKLRDFYPSFDDLCADLNLDKEQVTISLKNIDYEYDKTLNKFV